MSKRGKFSGVELKLFRHEVSILKSKGLVSKRIDARSAKPTRYMTSKVKKLAGVITGQQVGVKVPHAVAKQYRQSGAFTVIGDRVVVNKSAEEIATVRKGYPLLRRALGPNHVIERIPLPAGPNNWKDFLEDLVNRADWINNLKEDDEYFAAKVFGHFTRGVFSRVDGPGGLAAYLEHYDAEAVENFELFRVIEDYVLPRYKMPSKRSRHRTVQDRREATSGRVATLSAAEYNERHALRQKRLRAEIKADPVRLADKRLKDKARQLKARIKRNAR